MKNQRILSLCFLGFASGLPLALIASTLQAWFTQAGLSLLTIGALTLVGLPYAWKFLWAPLFDRFLPPFLGRRRGWIFMFQLGLSAGLFMLAKMNPTQHASGMAIVALIIAFISASQDIVIDAYRTDILLPEERGLGLGSFIFAYRIAVLFSGGLALICADRLGWQLTYQIMAVLMAAATIPTFFASESQRQFDRTKNLRSVISAAFKDLLNHESIVLIFIFIVLYKLGDALAVALTSNFLLHELHFSLTQIGLAYKIVGLLASLLGAFVGGISLSKIGLYRALFIFGLAQAISNGMYILLAIVGKNIALMGLAMFIENFCAGMSSVALFAFLTALCNQQYSATQYACLSALTSLGRIFAGPLAALMVEHFGWVNYFGLSILLCFPAILVLTMLRKRVSFNVEVAA